MMKGFYYPHRNAKNPINNADIIYTPDVTVFKTDTGRPKLMNEAEWYDVDVITCAAPNLRAPARSGSAVLARRPTARKSAPSKCVFWLRADFRLI